MSDNNKRSVFTVAAVQSDTEVIINGGRRDGLKDGDRLLLYRTGQMIFDPETNEPLGELETVLGNGEIIHCQNALATVRSSDRRRMPDKRRVFDNRPASISAATVFGSITGREVKEEIIPGEIVTIPFDGISIGDKARKVSY